MAARRSKTRPRVKVISRDVLRKSNVTKSVLEEAYRSKPQDSSMEEHIPTSKRDKRMMKRSLIVSRARASARNVNGGVPKRRRPAKKLKAAQDLSELLSSLPEAADSDQKTTRERSITSKPGVQKRRDRIARLEQHQFTYNLAAMRATGQLHEADPATSQLSEDSRDKQSDRGSHSANWDLLRRQIVKSMEP